MTNQEIKFKDNLIKEALDKLMKQDADYASMTALVITTLLDLQPHKAIDILAGVSVAYSMFTEIDLSNDFRKCYESIREKVLEKESYRTN